MLGHTTQISKGTHPTEAKIDKTLVKQGLPYHAHPGLRSSSFLAPSSPCTKGLNSIAHVLFGNPDSDCVDFIPVDPSHHMLKYLEQR